MFKAPVFSAEGERTGERELPESLFDGTIHETALWQVVKAYQANQRVGTAHTKTRAEVSGGNSKPWRQKGTGRARQGSTRAPHWRGGGTVFGPRGNRNYKEAVPKKLRALARRSALNARARDGAIFLLDGLQVEAPKTKRIVRFLTGSAARGKVLILTDGYKPNVYLSARNLPEVEVAAFGQESTYDVLWADTVVIETSALDRIAQAEVANA
ncbi:MAG: 50S ribosomal protein L4 [Gemmatimonadetes bacterium]|nr:50S ribosomal protein L4 [Gemmatimonadota bacterium]